MNTVHKLTICLFFSNLLLFTALPAAKAQTIENKVALCQGCHGDKGVSHNSTTPSLAGQQSKYLKAQLTAFKNKQRINPTMNQIAANLDNNSIKEIAAYFAKQQLKSKDLDKNSTLIETGKQKAMMCFGCHGAQGAGRSQIPRLAGQQTQYLSKQLSSFKKGNRKGGPMAAIAKNLSNEDIKAISAYLNSL